MSHTVLLQLSAPTSTLALLEPKSLPRIVIVVPPCAEEAALVPEADQSFQRQDFCTLRGQSAVAVAVAPASGPAGKQLTLLRAAFHTRAAGNHTRQTGSSNPT